MNNLHFDQSPNNVWKLFYNTQPNSEPIQGTNVTAKSTKNECFLYNCIFITITTNSAIYFTNTNNKFLNSYCSFTNCSSNTNGGSIYFNCDSSIVQYRSCGYKSKTNSDRGHHSYVYIIRNSNNNKNYLYESSFYECGNLKKDYTNYLLSGNIGVKSINTSFCKANYGAGILLYEPTSQSNVTYSSFCNTTSNYSILSLNYGNYSFNFCNVLNNKHTKSNWGTFWAGGSTVHIENCSFLGNTGPEVEFYQAYSNYSITVKNSFCDRIDKTKGSVTTINVQNIYCINNLSHFSTYLCQAEFPTFLCKMENINTKYEIVYHYSYHFIISLCIALVKKIKLI